jgi:hypothetical protein
LNDVSEGRTASIIVLMMEAVRTSETSVNFNVTTWRYIPEDSKLHTRHRESLKSHMAETVSDIERMKNTPILACLKLPL